MAFPIDSEAKPTVSCNAVTTVGHILLVIRENPCDITATE
jgi:hypothetical protein